MIHSDATLEEGLLRPRMCPGTCEPGDPDNGHHLGDRYLGSRLTLMLKTSWPELWDTRHEDWSGPHFLTLPGTAPYHVFSTFPARGGHPCLHSSRKPSRTAHPHKPLQVPHSDSIPHPVTSVSLLIRAGSVIFLPVCPPPRPAEQDRQAIYFPAGPWASPVCQARISGRTGVSLRCGSRAGHGAGGHTQLFHSPGATSVKTCFCKTTAVAAGMRTETRSQGCRPEGGLSPPRQPHPHTHAAAGRDGDLDGVAARLAHVLEVQGLVGGLVVPALDGEGRGVHADLHRGRPVGVHLPVLVVVALELQLQVGPEGVR